MKKLKVILSFVFTLGIICLGFSFAFNFDTKITASALTQTEIVERIVNGECVEKGGAIYLSAGSTYNMSGGEVSGHFAEKGGALYISDGAVFTMTGGTITGNYAKYGGAIYVASGGECYINGGTITGNFADNAPAIYVENGGILEISNNALVDANEYVKMSPTNINIYVDGTLSKTIVATGESYTIEEAEMPLDYESCCGYFLDSELRTTIKNDTIDLTSAGEEITFAPRTATASSDGINLYTRTADPSLFTFTTDGADGYILTKNSAVTYSGKEFNLIMPREYEDKTVTTIADGAFRCEFDSCGSVNITFSSEITEIPDCCFDAYSGVENCNIKSINIHNNITSIGDSAFHFCVGFTGSLIIGDSVTSIGNYAFYYCSGLTRDLIIPDSVISIGSSAFYQCSGLTSVIIGNSVTSIGDYAFTDCEGLTNVTIGNSVTSIGYQAFTDCEGLTNVIIGNSVTSIGNYAFSKCSGLTNVTIGNSVTSIGDSAFSGCTGLKSVIIPNSVTSIGDYAFNYCRSLTSVIIPNSVTSIENYAFNSCSGLTSVYIPSTVTTITASSYPNAPFYGCSRNLVIYTDVANASSKPSGWSTYWNYSSSNITFTTNYGYTLEQYKSAVGLTFAPTTNNNPEKERLDIYCMELPESGVGNKFLKEDFILNKQEDFIVIDKKKIA